MYAYLKTASNDLSIIVIRGNNYEKYYQDQSKQ